MRKIQMIKRPNGSLHFSINIPLTMIESLDWEKGTEVSVKIVDFDGKKCLLINTTPEEEKIYG